MNEQIKQITGQVLDEIVPETWVALGYDKIKEIQFRTAELIVRECACLSYLDDSGNPEVEEALEFWRKNMLKHFGVKE